MFFQAVKIFLRKCCRLEKSQNRTHMYLKILCFGIAKEITGGAVFDFEMETGTNVGALKQKLLAHFPAFRALSSIAIAVNSAYASDDLPIQEQDEIALIPPVSGG